MEGESKTEPNVGHLGSVWPQWPSLESLHTRGGWRGRLSALLKWSLSQTQPWIALEPLLGHKLLNLLGSVQFCGFKFTASRGQQFPLRSEVLAELALKPFKWFQEPRFAPSQGLDFLKTAWLLLPQMKMVSLRGLADKRRRV